MVFEGEGSGKAIAALDVGVDVMVEFLKSAGESSSTWPGIREDMVMNGCDERTLRAAFELGVCHIDRRKRMDVMHEFGRGWMSVHAGILSGGL